MQNESLCLENARMCHYLSVRHPVILKRLEELQWTPVGKAMVDTALAFEHHQMIASAFTSRRTELDRLDISFELLPQMFTLVELLQEVG